MRKILLLSMVLSCLNMLASAQDVGLIGKFQLSYVVANNQTYENLEAIYIFEKGGVLKAARSANAEIIEAGKWKYKKKQNAIILSSRLDKDFNGTATLIEISETELIYEKDNAVLHFTRIIETNDISEVDNVSENADVERLKFTEADFFDDNGDYKYFDDEAKLPWQDVDEKFKSLLNVKQLVYKYSKLDEDKMVFVNQVLRANVDSNPEEQTLSMDFIFHGFDAYNLPDDTELPMNTDYSSLLYPEEDNSFRVSGFEEITITAGTFDCTVVEVVSSFETSKKLWMINDKPGVFAKIISDRPGPFGQYAIYELQEIHMKE